MKSALYIITIFSLIVSGCGKEQVINQPEEKLNDRAPMSPRSVKPSGDSLLASKIIVADVNNHYNSIVIIERPDSQPNLYDWNKLIDSAWGKNQRGEPFASGRELWAIVVSSKLSQPDTFAITDVKQDGNCISVTIKERRFNNWESMPDALKSNTRRTELAVIPLGALTDGEYTIEVSFNKYHFMEMGKHENAVLNEAPKYLSLNGPIRCRIIIGKPTCPRLVEVGDGILMRGSRSFSFNGWVHGSSIIGNPELPSIYMEEGFTSYEEIQEIWQAALALDIETLIKTYPQTEAPDCNISLKYIQPDGNIRDYNFPMSANELSTLEKLLSKNGYGRW